MMWQGCLLLMMWEIHSVIEVIGLCRCCSFHCCKVRGQSGKISDSIGCNLKQECDQWCVQKTCWSLVELLKFLENQLGKRGSVICVCPSHNAPIPCVTIVCNDSENHVHPYSFSCSLTFYMVPLYTVVDPSSIPCYCLIVRFSSTDHIWTFHQKDSSSKLLPPSPQLISPLPRQMLSTMIKRPRAYILTWNFTLETASFCAHTQDLGHKPRMK